MKTYTPEFKANAVAQVRAGKNYKDVAKEIGVARSIVWAWHRKADGKGKGKRKGKANTVPHKYSYETKQRAMAMLKAGERPREIERQLKVGQGMVFYWNRHGIGAKPVGGKLDTRAERKLNGASHEANTNVIDAIVFLKKAKKEIRKAAAASPDGLDNPVALYALLALKTLQGEMGD